MSASALVYRRSVLLERGQLGAELAATGRVGEGAGEGKLVPLRGEGADDLVQHHHGDPGELGASFMALECLAREIEELEDAVERGFFVAVIGREILSRDVKFPRGLAVSLSASIPFSRMPVLILRQDIPQLSSQSRHFMAPFIILQAKAGQAASRTALKVIAPGAIPRREKRPLSSRSMDGRGQFLRPMHRGQTARLERLPCPRSEETTPLPPAPSDYAR